MENTRNNREFCVFVFDTVISCYTEDVFSFRIIFSFSVILRGLPTKEHQIMDRQNNMQRNRRPDGQMREYNHNHFSGGRGRDNGGRRSLSR